MFSLVQIVTSVTILFAPCPAYPDGGGCYYPDTRTAYAPVLPSDPDQVVLRHELGHAWDFQMLTRADRLRFRRVMGYKPSRRWWDLKERNDDRGDSLAPGEQFADNYAACSLGEWWPNYGRFCGLLPRSAFGLLRLAERRRRQ